MSHTDLLIQKQCEALLEYAYIAVRNFPKFERHVLAAEIRASLWRMLRLIIACNKRYHKKTTLSEIDIELDALRAQVRLAFSLKYIDLKRYETWARMNDELGRMLGGWIKSQQG
ncbi:MAG: diversity-generating retroelement protein Avd [Pseudomonadaceae bacterium]|nr:diversity-generating retroelement protein Avd [Pseudomonadaceae bacterium]